MSSPETLDEIIDLMQQELDQLPKDEACQETGAIIDADVAQFLMSQILQLWQRGYGNAEYAVSPDFRESLGHYYHRFGRVMITGHPAIICSACLRKFLAEMMRQLKRARAEMEVMPDA